MPKFVYYNLSQHDPKDVYVQRSVLILPRVRLVTVPNNPKEQTTKEPVVPHVLPPLILILLAGLHAEQPAARWVIVVLVCVVAGAAGCSRGEGSLLGAEGRAESDLQARSRSGDESRTHRSEERHCGCSGAARAVGVERESRSWFGHWG